LSAIEATGLGSLASIGHHRQISFDPTADEIEGVFTASEFWAQSPGVKPLRHLLPRNIVFFTDSKASAPSLPTTLLVEAAKPLPSQERLSYSEKLQIAIIQPLVRLCDGDMRIVNDVAGPLRNLSSPETTTTILSVFEKSGFDVLKTLCFVVFAGGMKAFLTSYFSQVHVPRGKDDKPVDNISLAWFLPPIPKEGGLQVPWISNYSQMDTALSNWQLTVRVVSNKPTAFTFIDPIRQVINDKANSRGHFTRTPAVVFLDYLMQAMARVGILTRKIDPEIRDASPAEFEARLALEGAIDYKRMADDAFDVVQKTALSALALSRAEGGRSKKIVATKEKVAKPARNIKRTLDQGSSVAEPAAKKVTSTVTPAASSFKGNICFPWLQQQLNDPAGAPGCKSVQGKCKMLHTAIPAKFSAADTDVLNALLAKDSNAERRQFCLDEIVRRKG
jgi:hypothetical protein